MFSDEIKIRVSYADTDQMGYMYYGNYARFYEIARTDSLRNLGITYREIESSGVMMPVVENSSKYIRPALYDEMLTIKTYLKELPSKRAIFDYEIYNEKEKLINLGQTTLAFVNAENRRPCLAPEILIRVLKPFFTDAQSH